MNTEASSLSDLLFGQTRGRVLGLLFGKPAETFFGRQIARQTGASVGNAQRELQTLVRSGLILRSALGRQVFYQANRAHPAFAEMRALLARTSGLRQRLRAALEPLDERVKVAFIYGSVARGEEDAASDVDVMIVGSATYDEVLHQLLDAEQEIRRPINPTVYPEQEWRAKLAAGNHFVQSVLRGKMDFVIGSENELAALG